MTLELSLKEEWTEPVKGEDRAQCGGGPEAAAPAGRGLYGVQNEWGTEEGLGWASDKR